MQWFKVADGGNPNGTAKDRVGLTAGTTYLAKYWNDNFFNIFNFVTGQGYGLIDDNLEQFTKASKGKYNPAYTYNTSSIATQTVNDVVLGSDGRYYEVQANAVVGDDPVGSITGNWVVVPLDLNAATVSYVNNKPSGLKNYIINGRKTINQRGLTSTDNSYNQDRWYKAGNNWFQGIEGINLISGDTYTLSWVGIATASYYIGTATSATINAQSFTAIANGGSIAPTITAGQNLWIKFASDATGSTFNFVQLEEGSVATPFENRPYGIEEILCQRYLPVLGSDWITGVCYTTTNAYGVVPFTSKARVAPTGISTTVSGIMLTSVGNPSSISTIGFADSSIASSRVSFTTASVLTAGNGTLIKSGKIIFTGCEL